MHGHHQFRIMIIFALLLILSLSTTSSIAQYSSRILSGTTERVSIASDGVEGNGWSESSSISADGHNVVFRSSATNLVAGDTNNEGDVFVHNRVTGLTQRVSVASDGTQANGTCFGPSISADGRYVVFYSWASNLVDGDTNEKHDVFLHDLVTGETQRLSVASDGTQGNGFSFSPVVSTDGRYVAFDSNADNLVDGDTNGTYDVFVHDRQIDETLRISVSSDGTQGNDSSAWASISTDGRYVAFISFASNLVYGDTNNYCDTDNDGIYDDNCPDIFVHDRILGETQRISVSSDGIQGDGVSWNGSISSDGRYVAFQSGATNLVPGDTNGTNDVFVHDQQTGETQRVSVSSNGTQGNFDSLSPVISADGSTVAFESGASNLVDEDTNNYCDTDHDNIWDDNCPDIFVHDWVTGETQLISVASNGTQGNLNSSSPAISADGSTVAFCSFAYNLVAGDTNWNPDVFMHDRVGLSYRIYLPVTLR